MFESWHNQQDDEETTTFWLQFQITSDDTDGEDDTANNTGAHHEQPPEFHLFTQLPAELRLKIWSYLIRPRIILAACLSSRPSTYKPLHHKISQRPKRPYIPVILHICAESREFALQHYELTFSWKVPHRLRAGSPSYTQPPNTEFSLSQPQPTPLTSPPKVYFNYTLDTLFLLGELEPSDGHGFNAPMVHFLRREDTSRVRHVACAFEELYIGLYEPDIVFGCLFHMVDRFPSARGVLPADVIAANQQHPPTEPETCKDQEEQINHKNSQPPNQFLIITTTPDDALVLPANHLLSLPTTNNVIQKLWRAWVMGSGYWPGTGGGVEPSTSALATANNPLVNTQMVMVPEEDLAGFVAQIQ